MKAYLAGAPLKAQASALGVADLPEPDRKAEMARVRRLIVKRLKYRLACSRRR